MTGLDKFTHLTFDCYGTLIDWEAGILSAVVPVLERHGVSVALPTAVSPDYELSDMASLAAAAGV